MNPPECYVINYRGNYLTALPATVIKETKSTITVRTAHGDKTFQKRKRFGEDAYDNPRELDGRAWGFRSEIKERGGCYSYPDHLTFDIERVEARLAEDAKAKDVAERVAKVRAKTEAFFAKWRKGNPDNADYMATLAALEDATKNLE
jgi:hypothetical protein